MSICAYCDNECSPSREHIIPSFLYSYQRTSGGNIGWNESAKKIVGGEAKIRDVCRQCNNGILSELDGYGKNFLTDAGVFVDNFLLKNKVVQYDHCLLLRWLMKLSFNSARAAKNQAHILECYRGFILGGEGDRGAPKNIFLLAGLVKPEKLSNEEAVKFSSQLPISDQGYSNPFFVRLSWVPGISGSHIVRSIVIGALVFHLVIFNSEVKPGFRRSQLRRWLKENKGMQLVDPSKWAINLKQTSRSFVDLQGMQLTRKEHYEAANNLLTNAGKGRS
ncbi:hypothetical protein [Methylophaga sp.]|uniref:hypothetical protein n=1 Tax=Methylophaga sp. TaxID=2024840 RepID=UPI00271BF49A|nr:hypothetical protein [Methylophaga sp.]MDO8826102.1 hypothetical protein [Methylophaga sp.]